MANIRLTRAAVHTPDPRTGEIKVTPALAHRIPHTSLDAICPLGEGENEQMPTARSLVMLDFGAGPMVLAFEETTPVIRGVLRALPGAEADWAELPSPSGEPTFFLRAGYVACQAQEPEDDEPRTLVWFKPRTSPPKTFIVAATDEEVEAACEPVEPAAAKKPSKSPRKAA